MITLSAMITLLITYGPTIVTAASAAATVLPKPVQGTAWAVVSGVINNIALNFGNAKNAK